MLIREHRLAYTMYEMRKLPVPGTEADQGLFRKDV
jgi:hypothetical protein